MKVEMGDKPDVQVEQEVEPTPPADPSVEIEEDDEDVDPDAPVSLDDLDPNDELWPGGPTISQVKAWKDEFGEIFISSFAGENNHIVWRSMNRFEYKRMIKAMEQASTTGQMTEADIKMFNEEYMAELCIIYPKFSRADLVGTMAGIPSIISQEIMEASGFVALEVRQL